MDETYKKHTNGVSDIRVTVDTSKVFDKLILDYYFMSKTQPFKRIEMEVKYEDMGNHTGADFSVVKLYENQFSSSCSFYIKPYTNMGMILGIGGQKIFVPVYDHMRDYYDNNLDLKVTYTEFGTDGDVKKEDVTEFNINDLESMDE